MSTPPVPVTIEKLVYGGDGLGRLPTGEVIFVPWSAPGDRLDVTPLPEGKPLKGDIDTIREPAGIRATPPCSVFGTCGGCQWQHVQPVHQREWKRRIVVESLQRLGKLTDVTVLDTIGSDETAWHYRNRVQWEIDTHSQEIAASDYHLGYYKANSHDVVAFDHCWIIQPPLNEVATCIRTYIRANPQASSALLRIEALMNRQKQILLIVEGELHARLNAMIKAIYAECPGVIGMAHMEKVRNRQKVRHLWGQSHLMERLGGVEFRVSAGSFFQVNLDGAEAIVSILRQWLVPNADTLLDVYAGVGTFALTLKDRARHLVAVENAPAAIEDARFNVQAAQAGHIEVREGDARRLLPGTDEMYDVAIVDPPRSGCPPELIDWLGTHTQRQILYVSCNPTTLARDLRRLVDAGWRIDAVQPVDMFPQTYHIEAVANLVKD